MPGCWWRSGPEGAQEGQAAATPLTWLPDAPGPACAAWHSVPDLQEHQSRSGAKSSHAAAVAPPARARPGRCCRRSRCPATCLPSCSPAQHGLLDQAPQQRAAEAEPSSTIASGSMKATAIRDAVRQRVGGQRDPGGGMGIERRLQRPLVVAAAGSSPCAAKRCSSSTATPADQLCSGVPGPPARCSGQRGHRAGVAVQAGMQVRVDDQPAADKGVDEQARKLFRSRPRRRQVPPRRRRQCPREADRQVGHGLHRSARSIWFQALPAPPTRPSIRCQPPIWNGARRLRPPAALSSAQAPAQDAHVAPQRRQQAVRVRGTG